jgi:two-component system chemotaxis response regulator CheB
MGAPLAVAIGCSAGGLVALEQLFGALLPALPPPFLVCCHTGSPNVDLMCDLLARHAAMPVEEAREREMPRGGTVYVAPSGYHLLVEADGRFALSVDPRVSFARPSIDVLFASAAETYGDGLVGVILTGANSDGAAGLVAVRERGGIAIVQRPDEADSPAMPRAALEVAGADYCVPLAAIAPLLNRICQS